MSARIPGLKRETWATPVPLATRRRRVAGTPVREMAKVCALCALRVLLGIFFGFGGLFFHRLRVFVLDGEPDSGVATGAVEETRVSYSQGTEFFEGLVNRGTPNVAMEKVRPGALHEIWVSGRSGSFRLDARRRSTLERFSSSVSELTYTDAIL